MSASRLASLATLLVLCLAPAAAQQYDHSSPGRTVDPNVGTSGAASVTPGSPTNAGSFYIPRFTCPGSYAYGGIGMSLVSSSLMQCDFQSGHWAAACPAGYVGSMTYYTSGFLRHDGASGGSHNLVSNTCALPPPPPPPPAPAVYINGPATKTATKDTAYSFTFGVKGGTAPFTFTRPVGSLPAGLSMTTGGKISGKPTTVQERTFTVRVTDANGKTDEVSNTIKVGATPPTTGTWSYGQCRVGSYFDNGGQCTTSGGPVTPGTACSPIGAQGYYSDVEDGGNMTTVIWKSTCQ